MPTELLSCIRRRAILLVFYARKVEFPRRELHLYLRLLLLAYEVLSQRAIVPIYKLNADTAGERNCSCGHDFLQDWRLVVGVSDMELTSGGNVITSLFKI